MLPKSHFLTFDAKNSKHFSNALRGSSRYVINCINLPVAQELEKMHVLYAPKFCRPTSGVGVLEQSRYSASIERVLVYVHQKRVNTRSAIVMVSTKISCSAAILTAKSIRQIVLHIIEVFTSALQVSFSRKWWFSCKVEAWNFSKNKRLKLVNSMKIDFLFSS